MLTLRSCDVYSLIQHVHTCIASFPMMMRRILHSDCVYMMLQGGSSEGNKDYQLSLVEFGRHEMTAWYASPYPPDYTCLSKIYICQFCLKYFKSSVTLHRHAVSQWVAVRTSVYVHVSISSLTEHSYFLEFRKGVLH